LPVEKLTCGPVRGIQHKGLKTTYYLRTLGASNIEKATVSVKKEIRGVTGQAVEAVLSGTAEEAGKQYTEAEVKACSINAMINGEECEACQ
jgi:ribonucleoside-diphosphate reductase alpha chain